MRVIEPPLRVPETGTMHTQEPLLNISDVAAWLGVSKGWVYDHTTRKQPLLPCVRLGEMTRFRREEIEQFLREHASRNGSR